MRPGCVHGVPVRSHGDQVRPSTNGFARADGRFAHIDDRLAHIVGSDAKVTHAEPAKPAVAIPGMPSGDEATTVSDTEAGEMEEHLRGLGYLESLFRQGLRAGSRGVAWM